MSDLPDLTAPRLGTTEHELLLAAAADMRERVRRRFAPPGAPTQQAGPADRAEGSGTLPPALARIAKRFRLSPFEASVLMLCAGAQSDDQLAALCARVAGLSDAVAAPTAGLAVSVLPGGDWAAFGADGTLRRRRLVEIGEALRFVDGPLRLPDHLLLHLLGAPQLNDQLVGFVLPLGEDPRGAPRAEDPLWPEQRAVAAELARLWATHATDERLPAVRLTGPDVDDLRSVFALACRSAGLLPYELPAAVLPMPPRDLDVLVRLWEQEALLRDAALLVTGGDDVVGERADVLRSFTARTDGCLAVLGTTGTAAAAREVVTLEVPEAASQTRRTAWTEALHRVEQASLRREEVATEDRAALADRFAWQFRLGRAAIAAASAEAAALTALEGTDAAAQGPAVGDARSGDRLWEVVRRRARVSVDGLAERLDLTAGWDDLVLPGTTSMILRSVLAAVRFRGRVLGDWGFAGFRSGPGVSALFAGPSGTGKTMAAGVLAAELDLDLYRVDVSAVMSKYIGETEKNLARLFEGAERSGAVLFFDEADALFGRRSEVRDSHDRYANLEVSYLLQRMDTYRGLAVLASNLPTALDAAFVRRLRFVVRFPFPDAVGRAELWRRAFPTRTPTDGLDPQRLASLQVSGGVIRGIALGAAVLAAQAGEPVRMVHVLAAAQTECAKLERPVSAEEIDGWT